MSLIEKTVLHSGAMSATGNGANVPLFLPGVPAPYMVTAVMSAVGAGTSLVLTIEHSPDNGVTWLTVVALTALVPATLVQSAVITTPILPLVRVRRTFTGGTTTATGVVAIHSGVAK